MCVRGSRSHAGTESKRKEQEGSKDEDRLEIKRKSCRKDKTFFKSDVRRERGKKDYFNRIADELREWAEGKDLS